MPSAPRGARLSDPARHRNRGRHNTLHRIGLTVMRVELLTSPGCPHARAARRIVADCMTTLGIDVPIVERVGRYPSPTVLVDDVDVMRPETGTSIGHACRLDLPTPQNVLDALRAHRPDQV